MTHDLVLQELKYSLQEMMGTISIEEIMTNPRLIRQLEKIERLMMWIWAATNTDTKNRNSLKGNINE